MTEKQKIEKTYTEFIDGISNGVDLKILLKSIFDNVEFLHIKKEPKYRIHDVVWYNEDNYIGKDSLWKNYKLSKNKITILQESKSQLKKWFRNSINDIKNKHIEENTKCLCGKDAVDVHHSIVSFEQLFTKWLNKQKDDDIITFREKYRGCMGTLPTNYVEKIKEIHQHSGTKLVSLCKECHKKEHNKNGK